MARANLGDLLDRIADPTPSSSPTPPAAAPEPASTAVAPVAVPKERAPRPARPTPAEPSEAGYLDFVRKDTRLREDQLEALTVQARRLNRAKRNTGVRITENTLIRLGIDLLLTRIERAKGDDEAALLRSLL